MEAIDIHALNDDAIGIILNIILLSGQNETDYGNCQLVYIISRGEILTEEQAKQFFSDSELIRASVNDRLVFKMPSGEHLTIPRGEYKFDNKYTRLTLPKLNQ